MTAIAAGTLLTRDRLAATAHPERDDRGMSAPDQWALGALSSLRRWTLPAASSEARRVEARLEQDGQRIRALDDRMLGERLRALAPAAVAGRSRPAMHEALTLVAELSRRALGITPYPVQLVGAATLLRGRLAEMQTGEGKTLTAGLAACLAGLAGVPVHVVTVNDYLAHRDAATLGPLYALAGLSVGVIAHDVEPDERVRAYASDIAYCTGKELVFDYLRDRVATGGRANAAQLGARRLFGARAQGTRLRGLHFAIVDEADGILIDEARTPLILAERAGEVEHAQAFPRAIALAATLEPWRHFELEPALRAVRLTDAGHRALALASAGLGPPWGSPRAREHLALQALRALHLFHRDQHYLVDPERKIQIIDEYTGRVLPGRSWEQGLHQMVEAKEDVPLSEQTLTVARITYQRFFCRYLRLAGMTGTARETARELAAVYRLDTVEIPTHRPCLRRMLPARLCVDAQAKWEMVADCVADAHRLGQPTLVGTRSLAASECLAAVLTARGLPHVVLNARQDADEATIVAAAGQRGAITVATNMAGRGTDIALGEGVAALGGLRVILTEFHESPRIDRQLFGRCARQGDPGEAQAIVALDDELFVRHGGPELALLRHAFPASRAGNTRAARREGAKAAHPAPAPELPTVISALLVRCTRTAQARAEALNARTRRDTLRQDRNVDKLMSFSGDPV